MPELRHRLGLDLTDPLAGHAERVADLVEGLRLPVAEAEAHADHAGLPLAQGVEQALKLLLQHREADGVGGNYGLGDGMPKTLDQIGDTFGVTRERIRQIESKTMAKLRHPSRSQSLRDYLE